MRVATVTTSCFALALLSCPRERKEECGRQLLRHINSTETKWICRHSIKWKNWRNFPSEPLQLLFYPANPTAPVRKVWGHRRLNKLRLGPRLRLRIRISLVEHLVRTKAFRLGERAIRNLCSKHLSSLNCAKQLRNTEFNVWKLPEQKIQYIKSKIKRLKIQPHIYVIIIFLLFFFFFNPRLNTSHQFLPPLNLHECMLETVLNRMQSDATPTKRR